MSKTLLYRFFGIGKMPEKIRSLLEMEQILVSDEGIGGWYSTINFQAPGKRFIHRKEGFSGWLAITTKRIVCYTYGKRQINISADDPKITSLYTEIDTSGKLIIAFESSLFQNDTKGIIRFSFNTEKAQQFHTTLIGMAVQQGSPPEAGS